MSEKKASIPSETRRRDFNPPRNSARRTNDQVGRKMKMYCHFYNNTERGCTKFDCKYDHEIAPPCKYQESCSFMRDYGKCFYNHGNTAPFLATNSLYSRTPWKQRRNTNMREFPSRNPTPTLRRPMNGGRGWTEVVWDQKPRQVERRGRY